MFQAFMVNLFNLCHAVGLLIVLYGALLLVGAMFGNSGTMGFIRGAALIFFGGWFAGIFPLT